MVALICRLYKHFFKLIFLDTERSVCEHKCNCAKCVAANFKQKSTPFRNNCGQCVLFSPDIPLHFRLYGCILGLYLK
ncbi:hypothetical protein COCON_G00149200 [Conger conger]|uniref:Uncharacterized protein n=1 Tax=Conger conger TaxID=82655 RepID=A0A9Q1HWH1_CONCO|nr:hypothetical protein COCON_G00149200 [Conger conger]